jgi:hypothetical protein
MLTEAVARRLDETELDHLADLARDSGDVGVVIGRLMTGGPTATTNLRFATKLRRYHAAGASRQGTAEDFAAVKAADREIHATSTSGLWVTFSPHAVERFVERMGLGHVGIDEASAMLREEASRSTVLRARTITGEEQWLCPNGAVLVIRRDGSGRPGFCTTILDGPSGSNPTTKVAIEATEKRRARGDYGRH